MTYGSHRPPGLNPIKWYVVMTSVNQHASFHQAAGGRDDETHDEQARRLGGSAEVKCDMMNASPRGGVPG